MLLGSGGAGRVIWPLRSGDWVPSAHTVNRGADVAVLNSWIDEEEAGVRGRRFGRHLHRRPHRRRRTRRRRGVSEPSGGPAQPGSRGSATAGGRRTRPADGAVLVRGYGGGTRRGGPACRLPVGGHAGRGHANGRPVGADPTRRRRGGLAARHRRRAGAGSGDGRDRRRRRRRGDHAHRPNVGVSGPTVQFCEPIGHRQTDGGPLESWQPHQMSPAALDAARSIAARIVNSLGGRGVFNVELLVRGDEVYFTSVRPRPDDVGLVTLRSQRLSQFELHARAVLGLTIDTIMISPAAAEVSQRLAAGTGACWPTPSPAMPESRRAPRRRHLGGPCHRPRRGPCAGPCAPGVGGPAQAGA